VLTKEKLVKQKKILKVLVLTFFLLLLFKVITRGAINNFQVV